MDTGLDQEKRIKFESLDGTQLVGLMQMPSDMDDFIILLHGITEDKNEWKGFYTQFVDFLMARGYGTLRFDFRGHGESEGNPESMTIAGETLDVKAAMKKAADNGDAPISIIATSFGAGPGIYAAGSSNIDIEKFVFIAPVIDYEQTFIKPRTPWAKELFGENGFRSLHQKGKINLSESFSIGPKLYQEFSMLTPSIKLSELSTPALLMHGTQDDMVPFEVTKKVAEAIETANFQPIKEAGHGFPDHRDETGNSKKSEQNKTEIFESSELFMSKNE